MTRVALLVTVVLTLLGAPACRQERATPELCRRILDRIVELELGERGYRDPVLMERKKARMRDRFSDDLRRCEGRALRSGARPCIESARHTEELSHKCLE